MDERRAAEAQIVRDAGVAARRLADSLSRLRADLLEKTPMRNTRDIDVRAAGAEALANAEHAARRLAETALTSGAESPSSEANDDSGPAKL